MFKDSQIKVFGFFSKKKRPIKTPHGTIPCPRLFEPELNTPLTVAIEKLEALKSSEQATNNDYILLGYFYSLEKKYDQSKANYLTALEFAVTDDIKKAVIEQELEKIYAAMREPE